MPNPAGSRIDTEPLPPFEAAAILGALQEEEHWFLVFSILWNTGLRVTEALVMRKADILGGGKISILRLKRKSRAPEDQVMIPLVLNARLEDYAGRCRSPRLFPFTQQAAWLALKNAVARAGIHRPIHPHSFRHGFAREFAKLELGLSDLDHKILLAALLGHSSLKYVERYFKPGTWEVQAMWERLSKNGIGGV